MTASRLAAIVRCADQLTHVHATVRSIKQQHRGSDIVLVADNHTPVAARAWLSRFAEDQTATLVIVDASTAGAARNAGIRATTAPYITCVDAGDLLSPNFADATIAELDARASVTVVTTPVRWLGPGSAQTTTWPIGVDAAALAEDTELIHNASVFRRSAWDKYGGFDESLQSLESYAMWLDLLTKGGECAIAQAACLVRAHRRGALYRQAWERDAHVRSFQSIVERHRGLFARMAPSALYAREQQIGELAGKYRHHVERRDSALREIEILKARAGDLRRSLPEHEANGIDLGDLRRTTPVARDWGYERGQPIDRYYIESFLQQHADDIHGTVLEVQEPDYTRRYGRTRVNRSDVVDLDAANPRATVVSDLRSASNIASGTYDCIILTQTVHVVDDMAAVVRECERMLKPGGVLLATLPSASRVCLEYGHDGDFWRVTEAGARILFSTAFAPSHLDVQACGNVLVNTAFLYGLACHEVNVEEFEAVDPYFPLLVTVRARKQAAAPNIRRPASPSTDGAAVLLYHRVATPASDVHGMAIAPRAFRAHMAHLRERYRPMPLGDLVAAAAAGRVPAGAVAVTFDDGYVDNFSDASPILTEYAIPATFFVTTDGINTDYEYWWDTLERILLG